MTWINTMLDQYYSFLKDKTVVSENPNNDWIQISTPFLGQFNDTIDIYAKKEAGKILLSDDGETIQNLSLSGLEINRSPKRKEILEHILLNYGVELDDDELLIEANELNFPQKKLNLLSAITETNDLFYLAKHTVASVFREDVKSFFDEQQLVYTPYFISKGSTGLEFTFDFQIASRQTELVIKSFNSINKMNLPHFLFTWNDIKKVREKQTGKGLVGLAIINDYEREIKGDLLDALTNEGASYILWSQRHSPQEIEKLKVA